jgi:hypothetical protein
MENAPMATPVPPHSRIHRELPGAYFHDCYELALAPGAPSAMALYLESVANTPAWVNALMGVRNRVVSLVGLKNLGLLSAIDPHKPAGSYQVGERVGIFSLRSLSDDEVILGDADKHLDVQLSLCKYTEGGQARVALTTVVHVNNLLGKVYMLFVAPVHKVIAPTMLKQSKRAA